MPRTQVQDDASVSDTHRMHTLDTQNRYLELAERLAGVGHWRVDTKTDAVFWSKQIYRIHGVSPDDYTPDLTSAIAFYHPEDQAQVAATLSVAVAEKQAFSFSLRLVRPDGEIRHVASRGECELDEHGAVVALFGVFQDVTEQVRANAALRESEARLQIVLDSSFDGYWDWHLKDEYEYMSPKFWEMFGVDPATKRHHPDEWQDIIFQEDLEMALGNFNRHVETKGEYPYNQEVRYRHADGSTVTVLCRGRVVEWAEDGSPVRMIGTHTDVTQLKQAEAALRRHTASLEQANRDLDHFAYIASHDLRAPLRGMDNLAEWIGEDLGADASPDLLEKLRLLRARVNRMDQLLSDILSYSRAGKQATPARMVDCQAFLDGLILDLDPPAGMAITAPVPLPSIMISQTLLDQVLTNLVTNAIKHHDQTTGLVTVAYRETSDSHEFVVEDDGPGIPEAYHARVFTMFHTLQRRDKVEGSGIGLAIVKKLLDAMGGSVTLHSPVTDRGTQFTVRIPKVAASATA